MSTSELHQLQARLRQTRILTAVLATCVVALAVATIWLVCRPAAAPQMITLESRNGTMQLGANGIVFRSSNGRSMMLTPEELTFAAGDSSLHISPLVGLQLSNGKGRRVSLNTLSDEASLELSGGVGGGHVRLDADAAGTSTFSLSNRISASADQRAAHLEVTDGEELWSSMIHTRHMK